MRGHACAFTDYQRAFTAESILSKFSGLALSAAGLATNAEEEARSFQGIEGAPWVLGAHIVWQEGMGVVKSVPGGAAPCWVSVAIFLAGSA